MTIEIATPFIARSMDDPCMIQTVRENADYAAYEAQYPAEAWDHASWPLHAFEYAFMHVYPADIPRALGGMSQWLQDGIQQGKPAYILNSMGGSNVLEDLARVHSLSCGISMGLTAKSDPWLTTQNIIAKSGDIITEQYWTNLHMGMTELGIPEFRVIFFYPQNGGNVDHITPYPDVSREIYGRLYHLLSPGGILFAETTEALRQNNLIHTYLDHVQQCDPQVVQHHRRFFSLVKTDALPALPPLNI